MMKKSTLLLMALILAFPVTEAQAQPRGPQGPTAVIVTPAAIKPFANRVEALGTTKANETVVITADTAEKVTEIHFEDGQEVNQGDLLLTLDRSEEDAEMQSAQAILAEAQAAYDRAKGLQETSALSKGTLEQRQATLTSAQAAVQAIQARIDKRAITAPFSGILGLREVSLGTLVQPGDKITTIDDLSRIKVDFDVPSIYLSTLAPGLPIIGRAQAFGDREFNGEVQTVNTQIDPVTRTVRVRAVLPNEDKSLKPGLLMTIILLKDEREALLIPEESLIKRGNKNFVYVVQQAEGKTIARETEITIGQRQPGVIEVLSGLKAGDQVVSHGTLKVRNGAEVTVQAVKSGNEKLGDLLKTETKAAK